MRGKKINIIITDDSKAFIEGLKFILEREAIFNIIDICYDGLELTESPKLAMADIILSDIEMPKMNGLESAKNINKKHPSIKMIALTMHIEKVFLEDIIMAGFKGFVYKPDIIKNLKNTIIQVMDNNFVIPNNLKNKTSGII